MAVSDNMQQAVDEYGSSAAPYSSLQDYLMQRPVYDRGSREAPNPYAMNKVTVEGQLPKTFFLLNIKRLWTSKKLRIEAAATARQGEIDSLRDLLRQDISTAEEAAASEAIGSDQNFEKYRIMSYKPVLMLKLQLCVNKGLMSDQPDSEQKRISDLIQQNIDQTAADLAASEERVRAAQTEAIGSLEDGKDL